MNPLLAQNLATILIFLVIVSHSFNFSLASSKPSTSSTTFIKECCTTTTYPKLCYATLLGYSAQIQTNPKQLATKSLTVALTEAQSAAQISARLSMVRGIKPTEKAALSDCTMAIGNSVAQLQRSINEMGQGLAWTAMEASDVQTWTSTALTYAGTCMDGLDGSGMDGNAKEVVYSKIVKLTQLTSNALALVKRYYVAAATKDHHRKNHP